MENKKIGNESLLGANDDLRSFFVGIYKWMIAGIGLSGVLAWFVSNNSYFSFIFESKTIFYGLIAIELIIVLGVQFMIRKIDPQIAGILFFIYASITGILSSVLFNVFELGSVMVIFIVAIIMYIILAFIGYNTKKDISGWGIFLFIGMIGVILASVINIFLQNSLMETVVSSIAILVFAGFTVYDHQNYKNIFNSVKGNSKEIERYTILGALHMYINLIAMFQNLLILFGQRED